MKRIGIVLLFLFLAGAAVLLLSACGRNEYVKEAEGGPHLGTPGPSPLETIEDGSTCQQKKQ